MTSPSNKAGKYDNKMLQTFSFPSIGDGISIKATSLEEAQEKAEEIKQNLKKTGATGQKSPAGQEKEDAKEAKEEGSKSSK